MSENVIDKVLTTAECWEVIAQAELGRLAYHLLDEVHITPINVAAHQGKLYFRTAEGSKLLGVEMNPDVAYETDVVKGEHATSVIVRGTARQLEDDEAHIVDYIPLRPWLDTTKSHVVVIEPTEVSGRRFNMTRPWKSMIPPH